MIKRNIILELSRPDLDNPIQLNQSPYLIEGRRYGCPIQGLLLHERLNGLLQYILL